MINTLTSCPGISDMFSPRGWSSTDNQHTHILTWNWRRVGSARLELDIESTHSPAIKGSATCLASPKLDRESAHSPTIKRSATSSVSEVPARLRTNTLTICQGISDVFGQRDSSSTEEWHTHRLSGSGKCSVSKAQARQRINTLTYCQEISNVFGQ